MDDEWHVVKKPSNIPSDAIISLVSLRRSDISFNCHFSKHAELKKYRYVTFYVMPNKYKIGFKFHNDPTDPNANKLLEARIVADGRLHSGHPWLKAITKIDDDRLRRFEPKKMLTGFGKPKCAQFLKKVKKYFTLSIGWKRDLSISTQGGNRLYWPRQY